MIGSYCGKGRKEESSRGSSDGVARWLKQ